MRSCQIGCGIIGSLWIQHHLNDGRDVRLWNRTRKDFPCFVEDIHEAVKGSDVVHVVVSDPPAVDGVLKQITEDLKPQAVVIQSSTISPEWSGKNRELVEASEAFYVEAPFTGSKTLTIQRQSVFFVGGAEKGKQQAIDFLKPLSKKIIDMGSCEQAAAIKLAMNLNIAGLFQALMESVSLARMYGISDEQYFEVLENNISRSGISDYKKGNFLNNDFTPHFSTKHMHKDVKLALESAKKFSLPVTEQVEKIYQEGLKRGWGDLDYASLIQLFSIK